MTLFTLRKWTALALAAASLGSVTVAAITAIDATWDWRVYSLLGALVSTLLLVCYGLARQRRWARWLALAVGLLGSTLCSVSLCGAPISWSRAWEQYIFDGCLVAFPLLVVSLLGAGMARGFELAEERPVWTVQNRRAQLLNLLPTLSLASGFGLIAFMVFDVPWGVRLPAFVAAGLMLAGVLLLLRQRTLGALLLIAAAAVSVSSFCLGWPNERPPIAAVFFAPLWLAGAIGLAVLTPPVLRLLRRGSTLLR